MNDHVKAEHAKLMAIHNATQAEQARSSATLSSAVRRDFISDSAAQGLARERQAMFDRYAERGRALDAQWALLAETDPMAAAQFMNEHATAITYGRARARQDAADPVARGRAAVTKIREAEQRGDKAAAETLRTEHAADLLSWAATLTDEPPPEAA